MEPGAAAAGAVFEERDGWNVAVSFPGESLVGGRLRRHVATWARSRSRATSPPSPATTSSWERALRADGCLVVPLLGAARGGALLAGGYRGAPRPPHRLGRGRQRPGQRNRHHHRAGSVDNCRPARARDLRALHRDRPAPAGHAGARVPPGQRGPHRRRDPVRGARPLPDAVRRGARPVRVDAGRRRRRPPGRRPASAWTLLEPLDA